MSDKGQRRKRRERGLRWYRVFLVAVLLAAAVLVVYFLTLHQSPKPIILYVNQGNGVVNGSNFGSMLRFASSHGFNTVFFQVYRQGSMLFTGAQLQAFANQTHAAGMKVFFALYITNSTQTLPSSIYGLGEDGISLDMSGLDSGSQRAFLRVLTSDYRGTKAVTTTDMSSQLTPDLLVLETYGSSYQQYIRHGTIASVGVFATSSAQDYDSQFQYALQNSDGVMVFDYSGLLKHGY